VWSRPFRGRRELDIGLVAYSPLGRGFLTGTIRSRDDIDEDDWRRIRPRFSDEAFDANLRLADRVQEMAAGKGVTAAQLALAWVLAQGGHVVPIPGTTKPQRVEENAQALALRLTSEDLRALDEAVPADAVIGTRYPESGMRLLGG
jgi:aryl-alcohol dehydrogenase-like predicted oxidoreductase